MPRGLEGCAGDPSNPSSYVELDLLKATKLPWSTPWRGLQRGRCGQPGFGMAHGSWLTPGDQWGTPDPGFLGTSLALTDAPSREKSWPNSSGHRGNICSTQQQTPGLSW